LSIIRSILTAGEHFLQFSEFARDPVGPIARLFVLLLNFGQPDDRADGLTDLFAVRIARIIDKLPTV